jgi:hypothetical protein
MARKLCPLNDVFRIEGRGVILVLPPEHEWEVSGEKTIHRHECIRIVDESGGEIRTFIKDFETTIRNGGRDSDLCFTLPADITVDMISRNSEIWLERDDDQPVIWQGLPKS